MVGVAQLVELRIVIPAVVGSSPIVHPISYLSIHSVYGGNMTLGVLGPTPKTCNKKIAKAK